MSMTREDYLELSQLLAENPDLRDDVRRIVLTQELLDLPSLVRDLASAQHRTEEELRRLVEAQRRSEERLSKVEERLSGVDERVGRLETALAELAEAQRRTEQQMAELAEAQRRSEARLDALGGAQAGTNQRLTRVETILAGVQGQMLEMNYGNRAAQYFGPMLRRVQVISIQAVDDMVDGVLSVEETLDLIRADLVIKGTPRDRPGAEPVYLVAEASVAVDVGDVERAVRRADLLRRTGVAVVPAVAGQSLTKGAARAAAEGHVLVLQNGRYDHWQRALEARGA